MIRVNGFFQNLTTVSVLPPPFIESCTRSLSIETNLAFFMLVADSLKLIWFYLDESRTVPNLIGPYLDECFSVPN